VLAFPHQLSSSKFAVLADSIRPADDLTRFQFFTGVLGRPQGGMHGDNLLVRASVEVQVGWDFGPTKVEDAYFALRFATGGYGKSAFLNAFSYGASPHTLGDLVKQRRRWAAGLIKLLFDRSLPLGSRLPLAYAVAIWTSGVFQHISLVVLIALLTATPGTSPVAAWIVPIWSFGFGYLVWSYLEGLRVNLQASGRHDRYLRYALVTVPAIFVFALVEAWAAALGAKDVVTGNMVGPTQQGTGCTGNEGRMSANSDTFVSVSLERCPMISAHGTW
jgi:beta-1,4-mannosyltransferase